MKNILVEYFLRHQNNINLFLHIIGIPLVIFGITLLFMKKWKLACAAIFTGYMIQYFGHLLFEHNQMGEWVLILNIVKRITGQ